jgi:hypothetical protein
MSSQQAYLAQIGGVPVLVLKEGTQRAFGKEAMRINIMVAKAVAEVMKSTLGPKGMDKMLIDSLGPRYWMKWMCSTLWVSSWSR